MKNLIEKTIDNGSIEQIHIAPIGEYFGSTKDGQPVKEKLDKEALQALADELNKGDDVLVDVDHSSERIGADRSTEAAGWLHKFIVDPMKGLFATLKLTKKGKELLENREYRYTSPVFELSEDGRPLTMRSVALTNMPAFKGAIFPILNTMPEDQAEKKDTMNEEVKEDIQKTEVEEVKEPAEDKFDLAADEAFMKVIARLDAIEAMLDEAFKKIGDLEYDKGNTERAAEATEAAAEVAEEMIEAAAKAQNSCSEKKEVVENACSEEAKKEEVIKIDALNTQPVSLDAEPEWKNLHGEAFFKYINSHYMK